MDQLKRLCICAPILLVVLMGACSDPAETSGAEHPHPLDLQTFDDGKTDGYGFNAVHLMDDDLFVDSTYLTVDEIQDFLEESPYGRRSFLADVSIDGQTVAEYIAETATRFQINPLVLLVKLQVESSLIYRNEEPANRLLIHAMGCGCLDGDPSCRLAPKGLFKQINCAARLFREYLIQMENIGRTVTGWGPGIAKETSEGEQIIPATRATAALYTYTPWILPGTGGNWLFWNVTRRFSWQLLSHRPNHHWIGGPCTSDDDCPFDQGICSTNILETSESTGFCTRPCETVCPDSRQPHTLVTTCVASAELGSDLATGLCTSRCSDIEAHRGTGCTNGTTCRTAEPADSDASSRMACVIEDGLADNSEDSDSAPEPHDRAGP